MAGGVLETRALTKRFRGLVAVSEFDLALETGRIQSLIGPNGAGKTTVFNVISGIYAPDGGEVVFDGKAINRLKPHKVTALGIARTFQNLRLFPQLTCLENVMSGQHCRGRCGIWAAILRTPRQQAEERLAQERAEHWVHEVGLWKMRSELARNIPYGSQKMLELARALATEPKVLLLDEPTCGLNDAEKEDMMAFIERLRGDVSILLVEHNMNVVMGISDWVTVMDGGRKISEGTPREVYDDPVVIEAYLGRGDGDDGRAAGY